MEKITFTPDGEEPIELYVLEETVITGTSYILVTEDEDGDCDAMIMKNVADKDGEEMTYEIVEDDGELQAVAKVFESMLEDVDIQ